MTDTAGYFDQVFGLFRLLGYQFSPRLADIGSARFWRITRDADYGQLSGLVRHQINTDLLRRRVRLRDVRVQLRGATTQTGHLVLDEHAGAAAAYVGMTRGRSANTVHRISRPLPAYSSAMHRINGHPQ